MPFLHDRVPNTLKPLLRLSFRQCTHALADKSRSWECFKVRRILLCFERFPEVLTLERCVPACGAGKLEDNTFVVMDAFALPVEGTETRVTALDEGYEYMVRLPLLVFVWRGSYYMCTGAIHDYM